MVSISEELSFSKPIGYKEEQEEALLDTLAKP